MTDLSDKERLAQKRQNLKILLVDDDADTALMLKQILLRAGYKTIQIAESVKAAQVALKDASFELIISDWNMPTQTGLDLLQAVRTTENIKHIPFIMLTSNDKKESVVGAAKAGVTDYVIKSAAHTSLVPKLEKVLTTLK